MVIWVEHYQRWLNIDNLDQELSIELNKLGAKQEELQDCFYKYLEFGTGGMRGEIGPGTNRMNIYTVRKATEGLAQYIIEQGSHAIERGVVIAFDSRHKSPEFALEAALTLGYYGIRCYLFTELRPTPELSFAVRYLNAYAGIVITASHNPPEYNGYKVYGPDGSQIASDFAKDLIEKVNAVENELEVQVGEKEHLINKGLLTYIGEEIDKAYLEELKKLSLYPKLLGSVGNDLKIVFTPLHGTANIPVRQGLEAFGFNNVTVVKEQELPDPNFSTVQSPNPEEHSAFEIAIQYGLEIDADILLGTDPDADRVGVACRNLDGEFIVLTGNQVGGLLLDYLLSQKKQRGDLPSNGVVIKTIVTSEIGKEIASNYGVKTLDTLTGFKYIGEKINQFEKTGEHTFLFGYEESYGYLIGDFVRDKDAVQSCLLIAEVAAYYKSQGKSLYEGLLDLFDRVGYYQEGLESLTLKGISGAQQIQDIMGYFRENPPERINGVNVCIIEDYQIGERVNINTRNKERIQLPKSNVIKYILEDESWFCLRPSGTEPKIKFYFGVKDSSLEASKDKLNTLKDSVMSRVHSFVSTLA